MFAETLIDQLIKLGADYFCISPGSRSTALAIAIANHPKARSMVHFDERGTGFHALGYGKATNKPAVVIVTTGTAAGNLMPAVMEADQSHTPLIIITADRPPELRDCSANQTIDQVKLFQSFVRWQFDLPCADKPRPDFLKSTAAYAVFKAKEGPVHINCMFREPFLSTCEVPDTFCHYGATEIHPAEEELKLWAEKIKGIEKGIILLGSMPLMESRKAIYDLADKLEWPVFADIISGARSDASTLPYYDLILKARGDLKPEAVLHIGNRIVSKTLMELLKPKFYFSVSENSYRQDPRHIVTHRLVCNPLIFCEKILPFIQPSNSWMGQWQELSNKVENALDDLITESTEPGILRSLTSLPKDWAVFLANSMPIRDADLFLFPKNPIGPIFSNRGVSGIDGNIATAVGIAQGLKKPLLAVLGDQTALHDINSLAQLKKAKYPVIFLIINNAGGAIFSFLPALKGQKCFEEYFAAAHPFTFRKAAEMFEIPYYTEGLQACVAKGESCLIEMRTDRAQNHQVHEHIYKAIQCSLTPSQAPQMAAPSFSCTDS